MRDDLAGGYVEAHAAQDFYGSKGPFRSTNCRPCAHKERCDFYWDILQDESAKRLYVDNEQYDGYLRDGMIPRYAEMVYDGLWYSPEREALQSFMDSIQVRVNGEARLKLYKGTALVEGRRSQTHTLYDEAMATFEADQVYDQADATGFIRLSALRLRTLGARRISGGE